MSNPYDILATDTGSDTKEDGGSITDRATGGTDSWSDGLFADYADEPAQEASWHQLTLDHFRRNPGFYIALAPITKNSKIDGAGAGSRVLDHGRERKRDDEECRASLTFGGGIRRANEERWTTGDGLRRRHAGLDAHGARRGIGGKDDGLFAAAREQRGGTRRVTEWSGLRPEDGVEREAGDMENSEHGGAMAK